MSCQYFFISLVDYTFSHCDRNVPGHNSEWLSLSFFQISQSTACIIISGITAQMKSSDSFNCCYPARCYDSPCLGYRIRTRYPVFYIVFNTTFYIIRFNITVFINTFCRIFLTFPQHIDLRTAFRAAYRLCIISSGT